MMPKISQDCGLAFSYGTYFLPSTPHNPHPIPLKKITISLKLPETCGHRNHKLTGREKGRGAEATGSHVGPVPLPAQVSCPHTHSSVQNLMGNLLPGCVWAGTPTLHTSGSGLHPFPTDPQVEALGHVEKQDENTENPENPDGAAM